MSITLKHSNYGKSRVRLAKITRKTDQYHEFKEVTLAIQFEGDWENAYLEGSNAKVLPTDTMKNTVFALAKDNPVEQVERFSQVLINHFLEHNPQVTRIRIEGVEPVWLRIPVNGEPHPHSFYRAHEVRTSCVTGTREGVAVQSGIDNLLVLKTTRSGFVGFIKDKFTTLPEVSDRIFSTSIKAVWDWNCPDADFGPAWERARHLCLEVFAEHDSLSVQQTLYEMGKSILAAFPDMTQIRLSLPNKHYLPVNLGLFGMENRNEIFVATDEPFGLIEATVARESQ
ncbi:MAG: urate oxidase [Blastocatellia bacterium]|nr:urate oxidase [Blastocatellia bacterium]